MNIYADITGLARADGSAVTMAELNHVRVKASTDGGANWTDRDNMEVQPGDILQHEVFFSAFTGNYLFRFTPVDSDGNDGEEIQLPFTIGDTTVPPIVKAKLIITIELRSG